MTTTKKQILKELATMKGAIRQIELKIDTEINGTNLARTWHPSDEAFLEHNLELFLMNNANRLNRSILSIKYKIAKIIKAEGVKV